MKGTLSGGLLNRKLLQRSLKLSIPALWIGLSRYSMTRRCPVFISAVTFMPGEVCAVLVADCLPVFLAGRDGDRVGIAHAGWRGLAAGVVEATVAALDCDPARLIAWLGPAIGPGAFEVGSEVRDAFLAQDGGAAAAFTAGRIGRFLADLPGLARRRLAAAGVSDVTGGDLCTHSDPARFYSYRRDGATGRLAALAWLA